MSAIVGIYHREGRQIERADLDRMVEAVAHRGPDGAEVWCDGSVGLGHRMLWTTPESLEESQPLASRSGDLVLTADARIDNREELLATLGLSRDGHDHLCDSELILAAYERWGEHCPEKLLGAFAFALWDGRKQQVFCARDHFGVKPFYYYDRYPSFAFGSEAKALLCLPEIIPLLNELRIADYLVPMLGDKAITFYQDILRLPPAHAMVVTPEGTRLWEYWSLDPFRELRLSSDREYADAFREIFGEAVRCRLRAAFPVGALLSGGLDSSAVACMARDLLDEHRGEPLPTFSAVFEDVPQCDERPFIDAVLHQGGFEPHFVRADRLSPLTDLEKVLWHQDEAFYFPNLFMHWGLLGAVNRQGVRVLLDGLDGDTTVSHGIPYLTELARKGRLLALFRETMWLSQRFNHLSPWMLIRRRVFKPFAPKPVQQLWQVLSGGKAFSSTVNPDFAGRIGLVERFEALGWMSARPPRTAREEHHRRLTWGGIPFVLEVADKAGAAFSVESRYPFFDKRLVEFCLALPPDQKLKRGWTRMVLRRAMDGILPLEIQWRGDKSDLSTNFNRGLFTTDRQLVEDVVLDNPQPIAGYVTMAALRTAYARCLSEPRTEDVMAVWRAVSLAHWLNHTGLATQANRTKGGGIGKTASSSTA